MTVFKIFEKLLENNRTAVIINDLQLKQVSDFLDGYCCSICDIEMLADDVAIAVMLSTAFKYAQAIDKNIKRKDSRQKKFDDIKAKLENN